MATEEIGKLANPRLMFWFAVGFMVLQTVSIVLPLTLAPVAHTASLEAKEAALESRQETIRLAYYALPGFVFFGLYLIRRNPLFFFGALYMTAVTVVTEALKPLAALLL